MTFWTSTGINFDYLLLVPDWKSKTLVDFFKKYIRSIITNLKVWTPPFQQPWLVSHSFKQSDQILED